MIQMLIRENHREREVDWKVGEPPITNAERVVGIKGDERGLALIRTVVRRVGARTDADIWFGAEAKRIAIIIGAAR